MVFYFLGSKIYAEWPQVTSYQWKFNVPWMIIAIVLLSGLYAGQAIGWLIILKQFSFSVPLRPGIYVWGKSLLARYVPGNVLMVVSRVMMIEPYGVPKRISLTSIAYEQALLGASAATAISVALPFWSKLQSVSSLIWLVLVVPPIAIALLHPAVISRVGNWAFRKMKREPLEEFMPFSRVVIIFLYFAISWVVAGVGLFAMAHTVTQINYSDLPIVIASAPLAWLVSVVFFISPSGLGVREGVYAYTLDFAFKSGGVASAFAILIRFWQTLIEIGFVLVMMGVVKLSHVKMKTSGAEGHLGPPEDEGSAPPL